MPSFTVTAAGQKVNLDGAGAAQAPFTVTNTSARTLRGRLVTKPREPAKPEWLSIVGESVRDFSPNAAEQVVVQLAVPTTTPPGSYSFRLDAVSEVDPDEDFTEGPSVAFDVTAPPPPKPKKFPWWIFAVIGAVVLLAIIGVVIWLVTKDGESPSVVPTVIGLQQSEASSRLADAGFATTTHTERVFDPALIGLVRTQDPEAGTQKPAGTVVTIVVGDSPTALVPGVLGLQQTAAANLLAAAGFGTAVRGFRVSDADSVGVVRTQDPAAGTQRPVGTVVTVGVGRLGIVVTGPTRTIRTGIDVRPRP